MRLFYYLKYLTKRNSSPTLSVFLNNIRLLTMNTHPKKKHYKNITDSYHQFFLPEYNGVAKEIFCKKSHLTLARISSEGHLEVFKGYAWDRSIGGRNASLVRDVLIQIYNDRHGKDFYTRRDIDIIFCNTMKQSGINYFCRKGCYFLGKVYSLWEKFLRKY